MMCLEKNNGEPLYTEHKDERINEFSAWAVDNIEKFFVAHTEEEYLEFIEKQKQQLALPFTGYLDY